MTGGCIMAVRLRIVFAAGVGILVGGTFNMALIQLSGEIIPTPASAANAAPR
jgi:hypothetical protein